MFLCPLKAYSYIRFVRALPKHSVMLSVKPIPKYSVHIICSLSTINAKIRLLQRLISKPFIYLENKVCLLPL